MSLTDTNSPAIWPPMDLYKDVVVVPRINASTGTTQTCGPIWPDWENQISARYCRNGLPVDEKPELSGEICVVDEPMVWAGIAHPHFGHFISEHAPRILQSVHHSTSEKFLYGFHHKSFPGLKAAPPHFLFTTEWFGLDPSRIVFCTENMHVKTLMVAPQAEQLCRPSEENTLGRLTDKYLDLLDQNTARHKLQIVSNEIVFVSRSLLPFPKACSGGSSYLETVLRSLGVVIFHPERHSIRDQLAVYAGAKHLIFAEGSAVHGLQLLGRNNCSVSILTRRPGRKIAESNLKPRCRNLHYYGSARELLHFEGHFFSAKKLFPKPVFDLAGVFECFSNVGIDLSKSWDENAYRAALVDDLRDWIKNIRHISLKRWNAVGDQSKLYASLTEIGLEDVSQFAKDHFLML